MLESPASLHPGAPLLDRTRFTTIAHRDHILLSPLGLGKLDRVLALLDLEPGARAVDLGCGKAEALIRIMERFACLGVGVDTNHAFLDEARRRAVGRVPPGALELHAADAATYPLEPGGCGALLCLGATGAFGGYRNALRALAPALRPGGHLLVGEGFWEREPAPEYLQATGIPREEMTDHAGNVSAAIAEGWVPAFTVSSNRDEWDEYEGLYARGIERHLIAHPDDPDAVAMRERITRWREAYLRWGRETLGFGLYLFARA